MNYGRTRKWSRTCAFFVACFRTRQTRCKGQLQALQVLCSHQARKSSFTLPSTSCTRQEDVSRCLEVDVECAAHQECCEASVGGVPARIQPVPAECSCSTVFIDLHRHPACQVPLGPRTGQAAHHRIWRACSTHAASFSSYSHQHR